MPFADRIVHITNEIRCFWPAPVPFEIAAWYARVSDTPFARREERTDLYSHLSGTDDLAVKEARNNTEVKARLRITRTALVPPELGGQFETWSKWVCSQSSLRVENSIAVVKVRTLVPFEFTPDGKIVIGTADDKPATQLMLGRGTVELAHLVVRCGADEYEWDTFAIEAWAHPSRVDGTFQSVLSYLLGDLKLNQQLHAFASKDAHIAGYAEWLNRNYFSK